MNKIVTRLMFCLSLFAIVNCGGGGGGTEGNTGGPVSTGWIHPTNTSTDAINVSSVAGTKGAELPRVAMDNNGNAIIAWRQDDGTTIRLYKSEYRNNSWTHPTDLANDFFSIGGSNSVDPSNSGQNFRVAMDNNGNAIIIWDQSDGTNNRLYKSEYRNGSWTHPTDLANDAISPAGQDVMHTQLAMDDNGNAIITWYQTDGTGINEQIYMSEYRNGSWAHPGDLADTISIAGTSAYRPHVAMDDNGNAIITWFQHNGVVLNEGLIGERYINKMYKSEFRNGSWNHPTDLLTDSFSPPAEFSIDYNQVAMDDNGNAIIIWLQDNGTRFYTNVYKSEYRNGSWTHPSNIDDFISVDGEAISSNSVFVYDSKVAMDNLGNAIIVWETSYDNNNNIAIQMSEYRNGSWTHPNPTDFTDKINPDGPFAMQPHLAMDNNGDTIIAWTQFHDIQPVTRVYMSEYRNGSWAHPTDLDDAVSLLENTVRAQPKVAMADSGNAIIAWSQGSKSGDIPQIFKSEYVAP